MTESATFVTKAKKAGQQVGMVMADEFGEAIDLDDDTGYKKEIPEHFNEQLP